MTCDRGYQLKGQDSIKCLSNKTWTAATCTQIQCVLPKTVPHSTNNFTSNIAVVDDVISYTCDKGYKVNGSSLITCRENGTWSESPPSCNEILCANLTVPKYGNINFSNTSYSNGTTASVECDEGYSYNITDNNLTCFYGNYSTNFFHFYRVSCRT